MVLSPGPYEDSLGSTAVLRLMRAPRLGGRIPRELERLMSTKNSKPPEGVDAAANPCAT